jgi:hypothetical protein
MELSPIFGDGLIGQAAAGGCELTACRLSDNLKPVGEFHTEAFGSA